MYYTRSKALLEHKAAGVLPFSIHEGTVLVLLGAEPCRTGPGGKVWRIMWRDFGGCREAADVDSAATAAREFAEETLGLFGCCTVNQQGVATAAAAMEVQLRDGSQAIKVVHTLRKGAYHFFCTQTPWVAPLMFRLASQQNATTHAVAGAEKSAFAWVPMTALLECVAACAPRYFLEARAHVCGGPGTPPAAKCGRRRFQLHPCFANSLRLAQRCGLDELISHAHELPLPPPPPLPLLAPAAEPAAAAAHAAAGEPTAWSAAAGAAGVAGSAPGHGEDADSRCLGGDGSDMAHDSLAYWLTREEIGAVLRGSTPAATAGTEHLHGGIWLPPPQQQQQHAPSLGSCQPCSPLAAGHAGSVPASSRAQPAVSTSSLGPSGSSSLLQQREAVVAAAVEQVVHQIEQNSQLKQRPSRKQRQKVRRQRQRAEEAAAAMTAAAAGSDGGAGTDGALPPPSAFQNTERQQHSPGHREQQQQVSPAAVSSMAASPPSHWVHAMHELKSAFQPHMPLRKRLRVVVGTSE